MVFITQYFCNDSYNARDTPYHICLTSTQLHVYIRQSGVFRFLKSVALLCLELANPQYVFLLHIPSHLEWGWCSHCWVTWQPQWFEPRPEYDSLIWHVNAEKFTPLISVYNVYRLVGLDQLSQNKAHHKEILSASMQFIVNIFRRRPGYWIRFWHCMTREYNKLMFLPLNDE